MPWPEQDTITTRADKERAARRTESRVVGDANGVDRPACSTGSSKRPTCPICPIWVEAPTSGTISERTSVPCWKGKATVGSMWGSRSREFDRCKAILAHHRGFVRHWRFWLCLPRQSMLTISADIHRFSFRRLAPDCSVYLA